MKVPFPTNNPNPKPATAAAYEPKSVLDLRGSPSPVADQKPASILEDHVLISPQLDEWDSLMRDLGLHDDPNPVSKPFPQPDPNLPDFPPANSFDESAQFVAADFGLLPDIQPYTQNPNAIGSLVEVGFDYVDELIRLAECFETNSIQFGQVILARLNQRLRSPSGKPLQRAAFYFKEALQTLLTGSTQNSEIIQTIKAHKTFSSISPIPMFSSFTANQAVLDAMDGSMHVHVVDFDIGLGGHWASFIGELSEKSDTRRPALRISALVPEDYAAQSRLISENLTQFARELNIGFEIDFVPIRTFEYLSFKAIKFLDGEKVAVLLSPAIFRQVGSGFLNDLRRVSPQVVVHVDAEGQMGFGAASYRQAVIDGLELYSTLLESLEAANFNNGGGGGDWMRKIETFVVYPKIVEGVEAAGRRGAAWREALVAAGLRQVGMSQFAEFQAECLLRRVQVRGFHVVKRQAEMMLCWHDRPLVATSAWRF
ncbi:scarecrow-like protein 15 [Salvia divinorum]|uniref:Scarecrow-like protein 15 n=1 Tax=Salvia divinorum TaxID=28513 RepID=A0ABD1ICY7_SALDI